jgi:hypothetical protein
LATVGGFGTLSMHVGWERRRRRRTIG